jgi:catechol 1,2-dioxygenase
MATTTPTATPTALAFNERLYTVTSDLMETIRSVLLKHRVTAEEYAKTMLWIRELVDAREVPLFIDNFFERTIEQSTNAGKPGSVGTVQGPYYLPGAPVLTEKPFVMPMRDDEPGEPMVLKGEVLHLDGNPIEGAELDIWHAGNDGTYSGFVGDAPPMNLRVKIHSDENGKFCIRTIKAAPYQIPTKGPTGQYLQMIDRHAWRPAHFHLRISASGCERLTTQIYFQGGDWLEGDGDVSGAVKEPLKVDVIADTDPQIAADYGLETPFASASYTFVLRPDAS